MRRISSILLVLPLFAGCAEGIELDVYLDQEVIYAADRVAISIRGYNSPDDVSPVEVQCVNSNERLPTVLISPGYDFSGDLAVRVEGWQGDRVWVHEEMFQFTEGDINYQGLFVRVECLACGPNAICDWEGGCNAQSPDAAFGLDPDDYIPSCMTD